MGAGPETQEAITQEVIDGPDAPSTATSPTKSLRSSISSASPKANLDISALTPKPPPTSRPSTAQRAPHTLRVLSSSSTRLYE